MDPIGVFYLIAQGFRKIFNGIPQCSPAFKPIIAGMCLGEDGTSF
jgi:hypothetical protein